MPVQSSFASDAFKGQINKDKFYVRPKSTFLRNGCLGTSRRAAGTALWSFGLEPAEAVSPHAGDDPWCEEGEGSRDGSGPAGERER